MSINSLNEKLNLKPIYIGDIELKGRVYIPPMAGFTDLPYRMVAREFDPDVLMSTEMLSSRAMIYSDIYKSPSDPSKMDIPEGESLTGVQLFGHEPELMALAAKMATDAGARFIDINMSETTEGSAY
jgi:tRNA-dihydrouridine synthase B